MSDTVSNGGATRQVQGEDPAALSAVMDETAPTPGDLQDAPATSVQQEDVDRFGHAQLLSQKDSSERTDDIDMLERAENLILESLGLFDEIEDSEDPEVLTRLARMHEIGFGVLAGRREAKSLLVQAAEMGYTPAMVLLAERFCVSSSGFLTTEGLKWLARGAVSGNPDAQLLFGTVALQELEDYAAAKKWLRMADRQGVSEASVLLATMYERGQGVLRDLRAAFRLRLRAAKFDNALAQNALGRAYLNGEGVHVDLLEAFFWFCLAASNPHAGAQAEESREYKHSIRNLLTDQEERRVGRRVKRWASKNRPTLQVVDIPAF